MPSLDPRRFTFVRFRDLLDGRDSLPNARGVYAFFLRGGTRILELTSWFELDGRAPPSIRGFQHMYTGAADLLGKRLQQHMRTGHLDNSTFRKTLLATQFMAGAISRSGTPSCNVRGQASLNEWLRQNAILSFQLTSKALLLERRVLEVHPSPFNITWRRDHPYARQISAWKCEVFPKGDRKRVYRIRTL